MKSLDKMVFEGLNSYLKRAEGFFDLSVSCIQTNDNGLMAFEQCRSIFRSLQGNDSQFVLNEADRKHIQYMMLLIDNAVLGNIRPGSFAESVDLAASFLKPILNVSSVSELFQKAGIQKIIPMNSFYGLAIMPDQDGKMKKALYGDFDAYIPLVTAMHYLMLIYKAAQDEHHDTMGLFDGFNALHGFNDLKKSVVQQGYLSEAEIATVAYADMRFFRRPEILKLAKTVEIDLSAFLRYIDVASSRMNFLQTYLAGVSFVELGDQLLKNPKQEHSIHAIKFANLISLDSILEMTDDTNKAKTLLGIGIAEYFRNNPELNALKKDPMFLRAFSRHYFPERIGRSE